MLALEQLQASFFLEKPEIQAIDIAVRNKILSIAVGLNILNNVKFNPVLRCDKETDVYFYYKEEYNKTVDQEVLPEINKYNELFKIDIEYVYDFVYKMWVLRQKIIDGLTFSVLPNEYNFIDNLLGVGFVFSKDDYAFLNTNKDNIFKVAKLIEETF